VRFEREGTMRILEHQISLVEVIEMGRMGDRLRPAEALQLLRSQPTALCCGRGNVDGIKFITIQVDPDLQTAMNQEQARKLPKVHATPQHSALRWSQQPLKARSGIIGRVRQW
jgi:hypothetical protein